MHRIDLEYHLLQFVAASLVRNIAANDFRLLPVERVNFSRLPDGVIGRFLEADWLVKRLRALLKW
ncbi:hypothetical protein [Burkholderia gladioli]|uniref:hypothetical protein n=1 Tax=Burkholderia gladioli TaxID=28095 RepID=UPI00236393C2|nr:hypothetical protein [Burkholderia gladioli]MDD1790158.1 hypothetical protein [Burkholderia gladioli]